MVRKFIQFQIYLILFSLILLISWHFFKSYLPETYQYKNVKFILFFYTVLITLFHYGAMRSHEKSGTGFMRFYMAATTFKLLILMGIMVSYALLNPEQSVVFVVYFFSAYLLYTAFETTIIFKFLK